MRIAYVSYDFGEYSVRLASALAQDAEVLLLLPGELAEPFRASLDPRVHFRPFRRPRLRQPLQQVRTAYRLVREIEQFEPSVVHLQRGHLWFNLALWLLRRYPLVLTVHDPRHHLGDRESQKTPQAIMDLAVKRADQLIVHGRQLKQVLVDDGQAAADTVHVIPMIALGDDSASPDVHEDGNLVLFFGRIWEYKGLEYLIRAEPLITDAVPDARIVIAGEGEDFARYRQMMVHPERFIVHNEYVPESKTAELFRRASVVTLPYVDASQSAVIPLAYTYGKPVVATPVGGLPDLVDDGRTGFLVPPREERALADAIIRLLRDEGLRREMGEKGRTKIRTECSPGAVAAQTLAVYRRAVGGGVAVR